MSLPLSISNIAQLFPDLSPRDQFNRPIVYFVDTPFDFSIPDLVSVIINFCIEALEKQGSQRSAIPSGKERARRKI